MDIFRCFSNLKGYTINPAFRPRTKPRESLDKIFHSNFGLENVHTLCASKPESDDRGNNISVKRLGTSLDRCIERYIKKMIIIIIINTFLCDIND